MTQTEMRRILAEGDIQLTKSLGQNFLHDANQLRRIVTTAELTPADKVLEVGPGLGPLTELLAVAAGEVLAIEKDERLIKFLKPRFAQATNLTLLHDDALDFIKRERRDWTDWKLVANLPYSVASPILVELAQSPQRPRSMICTLQLEVALRIMAETDGDDYGVLTLLLQLDYTAQSWFKIPAGCFFPEPDVDSACICLQRRTAPFVSEPERSTYLKLVKTGFSQRRKMMLKLLKQNWPLNKLTSAFETLQLSPQIRAEAVSLEQFVALAKLLS